jgi:hypothetical protein
MQEKVVETTKDLQIYYEYIYILGASVNRAILQHRLVWFGNTGADVAIVILLPTLKRFKCYGAVDWRTRCFCCERILQKR